MQKNEKYFIINFESYSSNVRYGGIVEKKNI